MSDEKHKKRMEIASIARLMLDGDETFILGSRRICALRFAADLQDDEDIVPLVAVDSETDSLPLGSAQNLWQPQALDALRAEISRAEAWAQGVTVKHCENLVRRFSVNID
ncbi:MAG: hypothetical protein KBA31_20520 [Alphaproteobacteria bacterium]|nr:hypothetical protein [Alphaproteobacteria bacterium]